MGCGCSKAPPGRAAGAAGTNAGTSSTKIRPASRRIAPAPPPALADPRWDKDGFDAWAGSSSVRFVRLGQLREMCCATAAYEAELIEALPPDAGVAGVQVYAVLSPSLLQVHPEPMAELRAIADSLGIARASDDDLVYWDHLCSDVADDATTAGMYRMFTHYRVQTLVLPEQYGAALPVFERLETMAYLTLASFCQRLVNPNEPAVRDRLRLESLMDLPNLLRGLRGDGDDGVGRVAALFDQLLPVLTPVPHDAEGFRVLVEEANIAWLPYPYVKQHKPPRVPHPDDPR